jgi:hypothetical protein
MVGVIEVLRFVEGDPCPMRSIEHLRIGMEEVVQHGGCELRMMSEAERKQQAATSREQASEVVDGTKRLLLVVLGLVDTDVFESRHGDDVIQLRRSDGFDVDVLDAAAALVLVDDAMGDGAVVAEDVADLQPYLGGRYRHECPGDRNLDASLVAPGGVVRMNEIAKPSVGAVERAPTQRGPSPGIGGEDTCLASGSPNHKTESKASYVIHCPREAPLLIPEAGIALEDSTTRQAVGPESTLPITVTADPPDPGPA